MTAKKIVYVTGVSGGLGREICIVLLSSGYKVIGFGRSSNIDLEELPDFEFKRLDLSNPNEIRLAVKVAVKEFGIPYALVNNAAVGLEGVLATQHESDIHTIINTNLLAPILMCKYVGRTMLLKRTGRIVNISSIIANTGYSGLSVYAASKSGMIGLTKSLARELGKSGIRVNSILPGFMETNMTSGIDEGSMNKIRRRSPDGSLPKTQSVANMVAFCLSESGEDINGTSIVVDAGSTA